MHLQLSYELISRILRGRHTGKRMQFHWNFYWNFCIKQPFFTFTDTAYIKCTFVCGSVEIPVYIHLSCSLQTLLGCSNTGSLLTVMQKRTATFKSSAATIQTFRYSTVEPTAYPNLYPNVIYSHRCSARSCNNVTTNSPKNELDSLLAVYSSDLVSNQNVCNTTMV
jgi:hypothetical protein